MQQINDGINLHGINQKFFMGSSFNRQNFYKIFKLVLIPLLTVTFCAAGEDAVKVSKWGFKSDDATACLQLAINSGTKKLIIDNTGHDWLISKTIRLVSNQELVLADGVTLRAKPGAFKGRFEPLLAGYNVSNVIIRGEGKAAIRMNKKDYLDRKLYQPSEWRHGIFLGGCSNVTIRDFTIRETGGDGISLGSSGKNPYCRNILVENMILDGNYRLAMAVISVDGLILRNSKLINTRGVPPRSGIDFEPNHAYQRIADMLVENCIFENNQNHAIVLSAGALNADSAPVSLTIRNCRINNNFGLNLMPISTVRGKILVENCVINNFIAIRNCIDGVFQIKFKNVTLNLPNKRNYTHASIMILCTGIPAGYNIGGIEFDNVQVNDPVRPPLGVNFSGRGGLADAPITGSLIYNGRPFNLKTIIAAARRYVDKLSSIKRTVQPKLSELRPPAADSVRLPEGEIPFRAPTTLLQYAEAGKPITINAKMNRYYHSNGSIEIFQPSGKLLRKVPIFCDKKGVQPVTFTPAETGIYRLKCNPGINSIIVSSKARGSGFLIEKDVLTLLKPTGRLYFRVPSGVKKFSLAVAGSPSVNAALRSPDGKVVQQKMNIGSMELFSATRLDASKDEVWSISFSSSVWVATLRLYAPLVPIVSTNPDTLFL